MCHRTVFAPSLFWGFRLFVVLSDRVERVARVLQVVLCRARLPGREARANRLGRLVPVRWTPSSVFSLLGSHFLQRAFGVRHTLFPERNFIAEIVTHLHPPPSPPLVKSRHCRTHPLPFKGSVRLTFLVYERP